MRRSPFGSALLLTAVVVIGAVAVAVAAPAPASAAGRRAAATVAPRITLVGQSTWVPAHGDFLIAVRVTGAPAESNVRVSVHHRLATRTAFDAAVSTTDAGRELFNLDLLPTADQPAARGGGREVTVGIPTNQSRTTAQTEETGVYPVQVRLLRSDGTILARLTTFLVRLPEQALGANRLRAALVLPLHDPLRLRADGSPVPGENLPALRTTADALQDHPTVAATLAPTPQSLDALRTSRDGRAELDAITTAGRSGRQILSSTYVRLDASAWESAGLGEELTRQQLAGTAVLSDIFTKTDQRTWFAGADLTTAAIGRLREAGVDRLLVPERSLAPLDASAFPESLTEPFKLAADNGTTAAALQVDSRLQAAFTRQSDPALGANQLLAQLALISFGQDGTRGGVVLAPPEGWQPSAAFLDALLQGMSTANPVVLTTTVDQLFGQVPAASASGSAGTRQGEARGGDLVRTLAPKPAPSLGDLPSRMPNLRTLLDSYTSMVGPTSSRVNPFNQRLLLAGSADLSTTDQDRLLGLVDTGLRRQFDSVVAPLTEKVTLTSRNADFPLTLQSKLGYPVNVVIDLQASNRLTFPGGNRIQQTLQGQRTRVKLRVRAPVSGDTPVQVTVHSPDGRVVLATSRYTVRVTAVSGVGVVLTVGAALFLVIWWIRHWRTSARQRNGTAPS